MALVERCRANVPVAFEDIYRTHSPRLFGLICRMVGRIEAEDLLQETFLSAHRKLGLYRGESALGTWLFRLATNLCLDHLRSRGSRWSNLTDGLDDEVESHGTSAGPVLGTIDRLDLERAIAALPAGARMVFVLHDVEGFDHRQIGDMLGVSDGTSKSQLHRARMRLRQMLSDRRAAAAGSV
jgi:RNA polymerase sigma-70 factor (ECF subfamily)